MQRCISAPRATPISSESLTAPHVRTGGAILQAMGPVWSVVQFYTPLGGHADRLPLAAASGRAAAAAEVAVGGALLPGPQVCLSCCHGPCSGVSGPGAQQSRSMGSWPDVFWIMHAYTFNLSYSEVTHELSLLRLIQLLISVCTMQAFGALVTACVCRLMPSACTSIRVPVVLVRICARCGSG